MRVNADSLLIRAAATSTSGTLNDLTTDLIMANNNNYHTCCVDVQLLATFQLSLALGDWWIGVFLGDTGNDNTLSCTSLIVWKL